MMMMIMMTLVDWNERDDDYDACWLGRLNSWWRGMLNHLRTTFVRIDLNSSVLVTKIDLNSRCYIVMANKGKIELKSTVTDTQCHQDRPTVTAVLNIPFDSLVTGIDRPTVTAGQHQVDGVDCQFNRYKYNGWNVVISLKLFRVPTITTQSFCVTFRPSSNFLVTWQSYKERHGRLSIKPLDCQLVEAESLNCVPS